MSRGLTVSEKQIPGPDPIQRVLTMPGVSFLRGPQRPPTSKPLPSPMIELALAYIDPRIPDCVLVWELAPSISTRDLIEAWRNDFLPEYGVDTSMTGTTLEFLVSKQPPNSAQLKPGWRADTVFIDVTRRLIRATDTVP